VTAPCSERLFQGIQHRIGIVSGVAIRKEAL